MAEDWDLYAIVRSCQASNYTVTKEDNKPTTITTTHTTSSQDIMPFTLNQENGPFSFPNLVKPRTNGFQELHQLFMTFNPTTATSTSTSTSTSGRGINPNSPFSDFAGSIGPVITPATYASIEPRLVPEASTSGIERFRDQRQQQQHVQKPQQQQQQQQQNQLQVQVPKSSSAILSSNTQSQTQTPRSRKRKSQQKKMVCHVTADNLSADLWAWRKYGQKPIKGSPYPRNYYRCSSFKGCAARKQVERSTTEPNMFIVTYTGEHKHPKPTHRNSLAGSTRNKPSTTRLPEENLPGSPSNAANNIASSSSFSTLSPTTPLTAPPENEDAVDDPIAARETENAEPEMEFYMASDDDDDDILIPNMAAMSDDIFLGSGLFGGGGDGDSVVKQTEGASPVSFEPPSNSSWPNPG